MWEAYKSFGARKHYIVCALEELSSFSRTVSNVNGKLYKGVCSIQRPSMERSR